MNEHKPEKVPSVSPSQPPFVPQQGSIGPIQAPSRKESGLSLRWIIAMMAWPIPLLIVSIVVFAVLSFVLTESGLEGSALSTAINMILFLVGAAAVALGPISFIIGLVFLIVRSSNKNK